MCRFLPCKDSFNYHLPFAIASVRAFLRNVSTRPPPGIHYNPVTFQPEEIFGLRRYCVISTLTHESRRLRSSAYVFKKTARILLSGACWSKTTDSSIRTVTTTRANSCSGRLCGASGVFFVPRNQWSTPYTAVTHVLFSATACNTTCCS